MSLFLRPFFCVQELTDPSLLSKQMNLGRRRHRADLGKRAADTLGDEIVCLPHICDQPVQPHQKPTSPAGDAAAAHPNSPDPVLTPLVE